MQWKERIQSRIAGRDELALADLADLFGLAEGEEVPLSECLSLIQEEYAIPAGVLRPEDELDLFIKVPPARGTLGWLFEQAAIEDKASELSFRLKRQRERIGRTPIPARPPTTLGEYVLSWVGRD